MLDTIVLEIKQEHMLKNDEVDANKLLNKAFDDYIKILLSNRKESSKKIVEEFENSEANKKVEDVKFKKSELTKKINELEQIEAKNKKFIEKIEKLIDHIKLEKKRLNYFDNRYKNVNLYLEDKSDELEDKIKKTEDNIEKNKFDVIALSTLVFTAFTIVSTNVGVYSKVIKDLNEIPMSRIILMMIITNIIIISAIHIVYSMIRLMVGKIDDETFNSIISNYFAFGFAIIIFIILIIPFCENVLIPLFKNNILPWIKNFFIKITSSNKTAYLLPFFKFIK